MNKLKEIFTISLFFPIIYFCVSFYTFLYNPDFDFFVIQLILKLLIDSTELFLLIFFFTFIISFSKFIYEKYFSIILVLSLYLVGFVYFFPGKYKEFNGLEFQWKSMLFHGIIEIAILIALIIFAIIKTKKIKENLYKIFTIILFIQIGTIISILFTKETKWIFDKNKYAISTNNVNVFYNKKNVILFVLDATNAYAFQQVIDKDAEIQSSLKDFIFFKNNLASIASTKFSIPSLFAGETYKAENDYHQFVKKAYTAGFLEYLNNNNFDVELYPYGTGYLYPSSLCSNCFKQNYFDINENGYQNLQKLVLFKLSPYFFKEGNDIFYKKTGILKESNLDKLKNLQELVYGIKNNTETFKESKIKENDKFLFKYLHYNGTHHPLIHDENLKAKLMPNNKESYVKQFHGSLKIFLSMLEFLKDKNIYDNSMIILIGDHGPSYSFEVNNIHLPEDEWYKNLLKELLNSMLVVKPFQNKAKHITIDDTPSMLIDIPKTILGSLGIKNNLNGCDFINDKESCKMREREIFLYKYNGDFLSFSLSDDLYNNYNFKYNMYKYNIKNNSKERISKIDYIKYKDWAITTVKE